VSPTTRLANRRDQILSEATGLFAEKGYNGTSLRGIAAACGITEAAIYRHFDNKNALYEWVIRSKAGQHDVETFLADGTESRTIEEVLTRMAANILSYLETDPELLGLMFNNSVETGPVAAVLFREVRLPYINFLAREIKRRIESGEVREVDPFITARCFVGMVMDCALSVNVWNKVSKFDFNASDVIANNVPIFARGMLSVDTLWKQRS